MNRESDDNVLSHAFAPGAAVGAAQAAFDVAKDSIKGTLIIYDSSWYVPHYTPNMAHYAMLSKQVISRAPTEGFYPERSTFNKDVFNRNIWFFESSIGIETNVPFYVIVGFQKTSCLGDQNANNDVFYRPTVSRAQCKTRTEKHPDAGLSCDYPIGRKFQAYGEVVSRSRRLS